MTNATLVAHAGTARVGEDLVRLVPQPEFTETWRPYSHAAVLDGVSRACGDLGLSVLRKEYSLTQNGSNMFGVWEVGREDLVGGRADLNVAIGIRNSTEKRFAIGVCAGERVFVCDNLVFSGDFVLFRRHSGGLAEEEIFIIARESILVVLERFQRLLIWHDSLTTMRLADREAALLTVAAMHRGLMAPSLYPSFHELYFTSGGKYDRNMFGWHGAMTELLKENSLHTIHQKNVQLRRFIDYEVPMLLNDASDFVDFDVVTESALLKTEAAEADHREQATKRSRTIITHAQRELKARPNGVDAGANIIVDPMPPKASEAEAPEPSAALHSCIVCGETFVSVDLRRKTCGKPACQAAARRKPKAVPA